MDFCLNAPYDCDVLFYKAKNMTIKIRYLLLCCLMMVFGWSGSVAAQSEAQNTANFGYLYAIHGDNQPSQLILTPLDGSPSTSMELPVYRYYAISPTEPLVAYIDSQGFGHIVNVLTHEEIDIGIETIASIELIYSTHQLRSGSLNWSPDGKYLAFAGYSQEGKANIYVYSIASRTLVVATPAITIYKNGVDISSWSPDGHWLTIVGSWSTDGSHQSGVFRTAVIARDGSSFIELGHQQKSCLFEWSPDQSGLVTDTNCFRNANDSNTSLLIFPFDPTNPSLSQQPPLEVRENAADKFARFSFPRWLDNDTLILARTWGPRGVNLDLDDFWSDIVTYTLSSNNFIVIPDTRRKPSWEMADENYFFAMIIEKANYLPRIEGYDLTRQKFLQPIQYSDLCPVYYTLHISADGQFIAYLRGCALNANLIIEIMDTRTGKTILIFEGTQDNRVDLVGFVHLTDNH
jgi:dipeptidyl aminopeptidase/acylaminoacyl peptidase